MPNQPFSNYRIKCLPIEIPQSFPVTDLYYDKYSPPQDDVTYMHFHNHLELGYCYEGCGVFFVNDKVLPFFAGDASIIFPNDIHIAQSNKINPSLWNFISIDPVLLLSELNINDLNLIINVVKGNRNFLNIVDKDNKYEIGRIVLEIFNELEKRKSNYQTMVKALVWSLIVKLKRVFETNTMNTDENIADYEKGILKIAPALNYISENYIEPISLQKLASICHLSITHFRRTFKIVTKTSPSMYITTVRIKMASILLLNTDYSILEISIKVGYSTLSSFNKHFKNIMSVSPREWKKTNRGRTPSQIQPLALRKPYDK